MTTQYARVVNNIVVELFTVPEGFTIAQCFNPGIPGTWIDCTAATGIAQGWTYEGDAFAAPAGT